MNHTKYTYIIEHLILRQPFFKARLNFTIKMYRRRDKMWGKKVTHPNGTWEMVGAVGDVGYGRAEIMASSPAMNIYRAQIVDYLPVISSPKVGIFIKSDPAELFSWTVFMEPLKPDLWIMLSLSSFVLAVVLTLLENRQSHTSLLRPVYTLEEC